MRPLALAVFFLASASAGQTPPANYARLCEGCHGANGAGGRGPALNAPLKRANNAAAIQTIIRGGVGGTEMAAIPESRLSDSDAEELAAWIWALRKGASASEVTAQASRGQQLFRAHCVKCHSIRGEGIPYGPDLSDAGRRSRAYLRSSIVDPQAEISDTFENYRWTIDLPDNFLQVRIVTRKGDRLTAARINEDSFSVQVRDANGRYYSFLKSELAELHKDWGKSPMPSFRGVLTDDQITDLVQFLAVQRSGR
jgi:cytochrome c oxidase cbb3-type subunit III